MKRAVDAGRTDVPVKVVRLNRASLCVNCEHISEAAGEVCPRCGSPSLISLARILNRVPAQA